MNNLCALYAHIFRSTDQTSFSIILQIGRFIGRLEYICFDNIHYGSANEYILMNSPFKYVAATHSRSIPIVWAFGSLFFFQFLFSLANLK